MRTKPQLALRLVGGKGLFRQASKISTLNLVLASSIGPTHC